MSTRKTFAGRRRIRAAVAPGWEIQFGIWISCITVAVFAALGNVRPAIFNEVLR